MMKFKPDTIIFCIIILFTIVFAIINGDYYIAIISAVCGMTYTFLAGKGTPYCYLFGLCGSTFYCMLSYQNSLWGNLFLYALYYIPMQIIGFFQWKKHLKDNKNEIIKISASKKELLTITLLSILLSVLLFYILTIFKDTNPILDSITTILSIVGMYFTVTRAIQQWIAWFIVNLLSLIMWFNILQSGEQVYSTVIMWSIYTLLAIYFYIIWEKELTSK